MNKYHAVFIALSVATLWGAYAAWQKWLLKRLPMETVFVASIIVYVVLGIAYYLWNRDIINKSIEGIDTRTRILLITIPIVFSFIPYILYIYTMKHNDSYITASLVATSPVITFVLGVLLLKERISLMSVFGVTMIVAGVTALTVHMK